MFRKEWRDLIKPGLFFIAVASIFPSLLILFRIISDLSYAELFFPMCQFGLFFWAFFMGASFLMPERLQRSEIYLLSLPYSRFRLLFIKILPRVTGALILFALYLFAFLSWGENMAAISFISFALIYFSLFIIALSFSLSSENFLVLFFFSLFGLMAFLGLLFLVVRIVLELKDYFLYELEVYTFFTGELDDFLLRLLPWVALILLLPLVVSFVWAFKKWDVRPVLVYNLRYFALLVPLCVIALICAVLFADLNLNSGHRDLFLTQNHKLIENHQYSGLKVFDGSNVHKIRGLDVFFWSYLECDGAVFCQTMRGIARIDLSDYSQKLMYECSPGREIKGGIRHFDGTLAFFTDKKTGKDQRFELLDLSSGNIKSVRWDHEFFSRYNGPWLFAADSEDDARFWLFFFRAADRAADKNTYVYRLWEDGTYEYVAQSRKHPHYVNRMLVTYSEEDVILSRIEDGKYRTINEIVNPEDFYFGSGWFQDLDLADVSEIYGYRWIRRLDQRPEYRFARLDLEDFSIQVLENMQTWATQFGRGDYYMIERPDHDSQDLNIYRLQRGELTFLKTLARIDPSKHRFDMETFETGLIIEKGKRIVVYSVPALEELKFKKLN
jgi:hypothetical protein